MFFSTYVLTKKGPLAKVWLAAHWDRKLTKNEVRVIDLSQTVLQIVKPSVPIALRTSGELMLGVVRIYSLKVKHVQKDAVEATTYLLRPMAQGAAHLLTGKGADGALIAMPMGKGGKELATTGGAVTLDIVVGRAGIEQLCEADFSDIADILLPGKGTKKLMDDGIPLGLGGGAWYAAEPSQFLEENRPLTQDDIAAMRADLMEFDRHLGGQNNRDPSSGSSKTKSSLSSVEAARQAAAVEPLGALGLDIGVPMPEDDLLALAPPDLGRLSAPGLEDPYAVDGLRASGVLVPGETAAPEAPKRRVKIVNIMDSTDTAFSREQCHKFQENRSDIVNAERRHGPLDEQEATYRQTIKNAEHSVNACFASPLSSIANAGLVAVFEAALQQTVKQMEAEQLAAARHEDKADAAGSDQRSSKRAFGGDDDVFAHAPHPVDEFEFPVPEAAPADSSFGRKRGREVDPGEKSGFSASTLATLDRLRSTMQKNVKTITFSAFTHGKKRAEVARTFVDVLVLASHGRIEVDQRNAHGDIVLTKTEKLAEVLPAA